MLNKFLKEVMAFAVGKQADDLVDLLFSKNYVNEFLIAKKLGVTINQTRNILYKISDYGLVSSIRKKDKRKGWYTYFWKIEVLKSLEFFREMLIKKIEQINHQIKSREVKQFYVCERCNVEFNEDNALLKDFTCDECGSVFAVKDNSKLLRELKKNRNKTEAELKIIDVEIGQERGKEERKRGREIKKEEKRTSEERKAKREKKKIAEKKKIFKTKKPKSVKKKTSKKKKSRKK